MMRWGPITLPARSRYFKSKFSQYLQKCDECGIRRNIKIIFVCTFDPFGEGYAKYVERQVISELGLCVDGTAEAIYLNAQYTICNVGPCVSGLLDLISGRCINADNRYASRLARILVEDVKANEAYREKYSRYTAGLGYLVEACDIDFIRAVDLLLERGLLE